MRSPDSVSLPLFLMVDHTGHPISEQKKQPSSFKEFFKGYLSIFKGWCRVRKLSSQTDQDQLEAKLGAIIQAPDKELAGYSTDTEDRKTMNGIRSHRYNGDSIRGDNPSTPRSEFFKHKSSESCFPNIPYPLSRSGSQKSPSPTYSYNGSSASLSRNASRNIMFSNSMGKVKPPAIVRSLECTLEELCYGAMKKIKITRDVIPDTGQIIQEEEVLTIKVKPGWKKGTKITFEGMGNERPGSCPADIVFVIDEKRHPLFRREGEDLEIGVEIPLVKALTGCRISIPLLGGENISVMIDEIIYPGYEKVIAGQGMPNTKEQGKRGNMKVVFLVKFPAQLTHQQRSDALSILEDSS